MTHRDSGLRLLLTLSSPLTRAVSLVDALESSGDAAPSPLSAPASIEATSLGLRALKRERLGDSKAC